MSSRIFVILFWIWLGGFTCFLKVAGQSFPFNFHFQGHLNENGLNFTNDILFDSKGRVWVASQTGFYRYDGKHYLPYRKTKSESSLPDNFVHSLCEDKDGNIWGGTDKGIFRFDPELQIFKRYLTPKSNSAQSVLNICCDKNGTIWATTPFHLLKFEPDVDSLVLFAELHSLQNSGPPNTIKKRGLLASANKSELFLATREGIWFFDISKKKWHNASTHPNEPLFALVNTGALASCPSGLFMYFDNTNKSIIKFDPSSLSIVKKIPVGHTLPTALGAALFENSDGLIWFSSWTNQILVVDENENDRFYVPNAIPYEPLSLLSNFFWQARQDKDGSTWLATPEGIFISNMPKNLFELFKISDVVKEMNSQHSIELFAEDPTDNTWWMTLSNNLVLHFNALNATYTTFDLKDCIPDKKGRKPTRTFSIFFFEGKPTLTTDAGAWIWHKQKNQWRPIEQVTGISFPFPVLQMVADGKGGYFLTDKKQLAHYNHGERSMHLITCHQKDITRPVYTLFSKSMSEAASYADFGTGHIARLWHDSISPVKLLNNNREINRGYINDMDVDSNGRVWICYTGLGLFCYDPSKKTIRHWDDSDGLKINDILKLAVDKKNNVWTVHRRQLMVLLSGTENFYNISMPIGNRNPTWENILVTLQNGNIIANSFNEIFQFFPERLMQQPVAKTPQISSIWINEKLRVFSINQPLKLSSNENSVRLQFGMLTSNEFFPYEVLFRLDGADAAWQNAGERMEAVYNKLPPGKYLFRVKAMAKNGMWMSEEQVIELMIQKPLFARTWFLTIAFGLVMGILFYIYRYRLQKQQQLLLLQTKTATLEREKATIQYDSLKQQLNPHFLFNSLTSLAGLIEADQKLAGGFLQRMSDMYRYILKNGNNDAVTLGDEIRFVQLYIDIQKTRFGDGLCVDIQVQQEYLEYGIAPVTLLNLVENAIKHNIIDDSSPLLIAIFVKDDYLIVSNNLQKKKMVETSNKTGLAQFISLYKFLSEKPVLVEENNESFQVKVPLISL